MFNLLDITVAILAGGFGRRLQSVVTDQPKVLAEVNKQPFLEYLLGQLNSSGLKNVVICTGYLGNQIKEKFGNNYKNLHLFYSREQSPLGTAGALRKALPLVRSKNVLVMNGDSFCDIDLEKFRGFHASKGADASLVLVNMPDTRRYGRVMLNQDDHILGFEEKKQRNGPGWVNAGIYLFDHSLLLKIPEKTSISFENKLFPEWLGQSFYGYKSNGRFIDIGTPQSYAAAEQFFMKYKI